jgi:hypothetical protein
LVAILKSHAIICCVFNSNPKHASHYCLQFVLHNNLQIIPTCFNALYFGNYSVITLTMFTTYQFFIQISVYWKFHCIVEVVSLIGFVLFVKGPVTGTVHDKDHIFSFLSHHIRNFYFLLAVD